MKRSRWKSAMFLVLAALLPLLCQSQRPTFTFGPSNYHSPATQAASTTDDITQVYGNSTQFTAVPLDMTGLHFRGARLDAFPGITISGNTGCSPHSQMDFLAVRTFVVPTLETERTAIRTWRATGDMAYSTPDRVIYLDLQTGRIVVAARQFNWTLQEAFMNYTVLIPNVVDLSQYLAALRDLTQVVQGIATGQPPWTSPGAPCNQPVPAVKNTLAYLESIRVELGNSSSVNGGLRPTEVRLPSGCIEEIDANYKGDLLTDILPNTTSGDMCCQACRNTTDCNVWVWCPLTDGCATGSGSFPYLGCQLKHQANVSTSAAPQPLPDAWERGPPTGFVSGRLAYT